MKKFNLNLSNITDKDHVQDWVLLFKSSLGSDNVEISNYFKSGYTNIILEEFSKSDSIDQLVDFKLRCPNDKIVCFLTEFMEPNSYYMNSFSKSSEFVNRLFSQEYASPIIKYLSNFLHRIIRIYIFLIKVFNFFIIKISKINSTILSLQINTSYFAKINYFLLRLKNLQYVDPFIDFYICGYQEQIVGWSKMLNNQIIIFPYYISKDCFKLIEEKKSNKSFTYGSLSNFRNKCISYLNDLNIKIPVNYNFLKTDELKNLFSSNLKLFFIPNVESNKYSSSLKSWYAINNGCVPVNLETEIFTYFEKSLEVPNFKIYEIEKINNLEKLEILNVFNKNYDKYLVEHEKIKKKFNEALNSDD